MAVSVGNTHLQQDKEGGLDEARIAANTPVVEEVVEEATEDAPVAEADASSEEE